MGFKNWETPPDFFKALNDEFHFTLDAAASHENALCPYYCTENGSIIDGGVVDTDGLSTNWNGYRVFCNPPYDASLSDWGRKAGKTRGDLVVLLLPPSVDTTWYTRLLGQFQGLTRITGRRWGETFWQGPAQLDEKFALLTMQGRLKFWHPAIRTPYKLKDHVSLGDAIFDFSLPHVPGPQPRAGNMLAIWRK